MSLVSGAGNITDIIRQNKWVLIIGGAAGLLLSSAFSHKLGGKMDKIITIASIAAAGAGVYGQVLDMQGATKAGLARPEFPAYHYMNAVYDYPYVPPVGRYMSYG